MKTTHALGIGFLFILAVFLWVYPFPKSIDRAIPAVMTVEKAVETPGTDSKIEQPTVIRVKGEVYRKLFREPDYNVSVTVDDLDWTAGAGSIIPMSRGGGVRMATVLYTELKPGGVMGDRTRTALIWFDDDFEQVHLWGQELLPDEPVVLEEVFVTGEASDAGQAEQRLAEMRRAFESSEEGAVWGVKGPDASS